MSDIEIKEICEKYNITNYTIKDGLINVDGNVYLRNKGLIKLPLKFGEVTGYFDCSYNDFSSLDGSPSYVGRNFYCQVNLLSSLEGSPTYVGGNFYCYNNELTDFKGCPDEVEGDFDCYNNKIYSLEGLLFKRINYITIEDNSIFNLYYKYNLDDVDHREFLIEADVIRPPDEVGGLPIINKDRMDWFTQTYGLKEFIGDQNYKLEI